MVRIRPFRALRPRPEFAARIAAVPYDVVNVEEARSLASENPLSFLHVSRAEIDLPPETSPYADAVYAKAVENFAALGRSMVREDTPSLYFYRLRMGTHAQVGLAACFSIADYEQNRVKKHETTRPDKEDDRTRHLLALGAQTGPVFLTYRRRPSLDVIAESATAGEPLYDFQAPDLVQHTLWRATDSAVPAIVGEMATLDAIYIADGHHRAASAARAHQHSKAAGRGASDEADHAWFLAVAFPDNQAQILPYNRLVRDLAGLAPDEFLARLRARFDVRAGRPSSTRKGQCAMFFESAWHTVTLGGGVPEGADPIRSLDVSRLQDGVLEPILKVVDPRTDKRIDFVGGIRGDGELERAVARGEAAVAFSLHPVTVGELMAIADAGSIMPPKSTWFEPKLRDGLLSHLINEDSHR